MNTLEFLTIASAIVPDRAAIVFEGRRLSFHRLQHQVNRLTNALANLGLQPGQRVAFMDVNTPELIQTYLACAQLDAIFVPLNYRARAHEVSQMLQLCDPTLFIVGRRYQDLVDSVIQDSPSLRHVIALEQRPTHDWLFFDDLISAAPADELHYPSSTDTDTTLLLFTSGTTGAPKAVKLTHQSFSSYMLSSVTPADPDVEERNLLSLPMYHVAGIQSALAAIYGGRTLLLARQFEAQQWMELVQREKAHRAGMVPTMLKQVLDHPQFPHYDLSSLRVISYGAAPMPPEVIRKAIQLLPHARFINAFGQTETASTITMLSPEDHVLEGDPEEVEKRLRRLTSVGRALDDVEIAILDESGAPLPQGQEGEVAARGPRLMSGYWADEQATPQRLSPRLAPHWRPRLSRRGRLPLSFRSLQGLYQARRRDDLPPGGGRRPPFPSRRPGSRRYRCPRHPMGRTCPRHRHPPTRSPSNPRRSHPALPPPPGKLQAPGVSRIRDRDPQKSHGQSPQARPPLPLQFPHPQPRC